MKFVTINPEKREIGFVEANEVHEALPQIGLKSGNVDFGSLSPTTAIVVYEWGLAKQGFHYFAINGRLYAGNALIFQADEAGETVNFTEPVPHIEWLGNAYDVEAAIQAGKVNRPYNAVNGKVYWQWSPDKLEP